MSSFRNAAKSRQKPHRERSQPSFRQELGHLEKKKDYQVRTRDRHIKDKAIAKIKKRVSERNPDEFNRQMIGTKLKDGVHRAKKQTEINDPDQIKLIQSQDKRYVEYRRLLDMKKSEKLKQSLHSIEDGQRNHHTFFVDNDKQVEEFDLTKHLNTHPSLVDKAYNRLTLDQLGDLEMISSLPTPQQMAEAMKAKEDSYKELSRRQKREQELLITQQKLELKTQLLDKKSKRKMVKAECKSKAAVYKWQAKRKR